jgi:predicted RNase H-like nuclease
MFAGIDGCPAGWVFVLFDEGDIQFDITSSIQNMDYISKNNLTLIDIPIGLPEKSRRVCDLDARQILKPFRHNSVFLTPVREAVYADSYKNACEKNYSAIGKKISKQMWAICEKIKEVDDFKQQNPLLLLRESHPELCFWSLNNESACHFNKKKKEGRRERLTILDIAIPDISEHILSYADATLRKHVAIDDIIDAAVLAITAMKSEQLKTIGNGEIDKKDLQMEIVF